MNDRERAEKLWQILDDIDTKSDMIKPVSFKDFRFFYEHVMEKIRGRNDILKSDGYKLYTPEEWNKKYDPKFFVPVEVDKDGT